MIIVWYKIKHFWILLLDGLNKPLIGLIKQALLTINLTPSYDKKTIYYLHLNK
jgi:hypothetical protein